MPELVLHGQPVATVFGLLGRDENDMTYALGWGLSNSRRLLEAFVERIAPGAPLAEPVVIDLQAHDAADGGYTDIELLTADVHVIVEAKRGWAPPGEAQLRRYEARFDRAARPRQSLVILTQNGAEAVVRHQLGPWDPPPPIEPRVLGWDDVVRLGWDAGRGGPIAERRLVRELASYLGGLADMRDTNSNSVYVVSLGATRWGGWDHSPIDIVEQFGRYFFPASGGGWPKTPPNYVAFRYWAKLQSIHHVDDYTIFDNPHQVEATWPDMEWQPHFCLTLGPAMRPPHESPTGPGIRRSMRVWAEIDLLITAGSITEAHRLTKARRAG